MQSVKRLLSLYIHWALFIFLCLSSICSILFFLDIFHPYKFLALLNIDYQVLQTTLPNMDSKQVLLILWLVSLILMPLWFLTNRYLRQYEAKKFNKILQAQDRFDKLLGHMITDSWGRITWASEVFQKVFKIVPTYKKMKVNFIDVLKEFPDIEIDERIIKSIEHNFLQHNSGTIEVNLKIGAYSNALKITYMKLFSSAYVWQVKLVNVNYSAINYNFVSDVLDNLPITTVIVNPKCKIIYYNLMFMKLFKIQQEDIEATLNINNFMLDCDFSTIIKKAFNQDVETTHIAQYNFKDLQNNKFVGSLLLQSLYKNDMGGLRYVRVMILPLTINSALHEGKMVQNFQANNLQNLQNIYNHAPFGIIIFDKKNKILNLNVFIKDLFKINPAENIKTLNDLLGDYTKQVQDNIKQKSAKLSIEIELKGVMKSLELSLFPIDEETQIMYIQDTSEQRGLESQIKLSQGLQTIGQIASVVAHDFNNLLTAIMSFTYFLKERFDEDDPSVLELEQIKQNANRAKVMIKQLLTFSRKQELSPVVFELNSEISDLLSTLLRLIGDRIKLDFHRGKNVGKILMDKVQFHQVLTNLVMNAKDAMGSNVTLKIITKNINLKSPKEGVLGTIPSGVYVVMQLQDQGEGIKPENLKIIFQSHFSTKGEKGNGLGLATVLKIVSDNAGFIDVESTLGKGSTFSVYFPKEEAKVELIEVDESVIYQDLTGSEQILLVEDETPVRMVCARLLKQKGYNVIEAESGMDALAKIEKDKISYIDLIISDVMMPGISGPELISRIKDIFPNIKAILMSGYAEDVLDDIDSDTALKGIEFLAKPFTPDVFATKVKSILISGKK